MNEASLSLMRLNAANRHQRDKPQGQQVRVWLRGFERAVRRSPLRMPVILPPDTWAEWVAEEPADEAALKKMLVPDPAEPMTMWPVDKRVGKVKNNDASLIEPLSAQ